MRPAGKWVPCSAPASQRSALYAAAGCGHPKSNDQTRDPFQTTQERIHIEKYFIPAVAVPAVVATPIMAHAVTIDFSFTGNGGGTVSGYLEFASPDGVQDPTAVHVTSAPAPYRAPIDFFQSSFHTGGFTLSHGVVKAAYFAVTKLSIYGSFTEKGDVLGLNKQAGHVYYSNWTYLQGSVNSRMTSNRKGFSGITFSTVPEPSTIALLGAGLPGISMFRRRRARAS